jgi:hypothetical protein
MRALLVVGQLVILNFLLCHGTVCVVGRMRDLILQLSKSSIYSTKPFDRIILSQMR